MATIASIDSSSMNCHPRPPASPSSSPYPSRESSLILGDCDTSFVARQNPIAVEVATISNGLEFIYAESVLGLASDVCELCSI
jgi:hypothetical protein